MQSKAFPHTCLYCVPLDPHLSHGMSVNTPMPLVWTTLQIASHDEQTHCRSNITAYARQPCLPRTHLPIVHPLCLFNNFLGTENGICEVISDQGCKERRCEGQRGVSHLGVLTPERPYARVSLCCFLEGTWEICDFPYRKT